MGMRDKTDERLWKPEWYPKIGLVGSEGNALGLHSAESFVLFP